MPHPQNPLGSVKCSATAKTTGEQCTQWAMHGGTVCRMHGGEAPQVRAKANERIAAMVYPALKRVETLIGAEDDEEVNDPGLEAVRLRAAFGILDRAGYTATQKLAVSGDLTVRSPVDLEMEEIARRIRDNDRERQET